MANRAMEEGIKKSQKKLFSLVQLVSFNVT